MRTTIFALCLLAALVLTSVAAAQNPNTARGFDADKAYSLGDLDHVNVFNGNLIVTIPIGPTYPVGGALSYGFKLVYNGNAWDYVAMPEDTMLAIPNKFANVGLGWQFSLGELIGPSVPLDGTGRWNYGSPDGAERPFYRTLHAEELTNPQAPTQYAGKLDPANGDVVGYTRDSTYLRLIRVGRTMIEETADPEGGPPHRLWNATYMIEFPDGTMHTFLGEFETDTIAFPTYATEQKVRYRLVKMEDRFGNYVQVAYSYPQPNPNDPVPISEQWTITDSTGRSHIVDLTSRTYFQYHQSPVSRNLVAKVKLAAFDSDGNPATEDRAVYEFLRGPYEDISEPCADSFDNTLPNSNVEKTRPVKTLFLTGIRLPDNSLYALGTPGHYNRTVMSGNLVACSWASGHMRRLDLPTSGRLEWDVDLRAFPDLQPPASGPWQVMKPHLAVSSAVTKRRLAGGQPYGLETPPEWSYRAQLANFATVASTRSAIDSIARELIVTVTDPANISTVHFFNALKAGHDSCYPSGGDAEYGLPFTRSDGTNIGTLLLSTESYAGKCDTFDVSQASGCQSRGVCTMNVSVNGQPQTVSLAPIRRTYVTYEQDTSGPGADLTSPRLQASRTEFTDDPSCGGVACYVQSEFSESDGLGHYRLEKRTSNFPGTLERRLRTNYNVKGGSYTANSGANPDDYMVAPAEPWVLGVYDETTQAEGTAAQFAAGTAPTAKQLFCFDGATGFLTRTRTLGSAPSRNDLLTLFAKNTKGEVTEESFYGGDVNLLPVAFDTCDDTPGVRDYAIAHTYDYGARRSSQHVGATFKWLDLTIDRNTGLASASRDTGGLQTTYRYDTLARISEIRPPGEAWTLIAYDSATNPSSVRVRRFAPSAVLTSVPPPEPLTEQWFYYDGLGRLEQSRERWPHSWRTVTTQYDKLGRADRVAVPEYRSASGYENLVSGITNYKGFTFDALGRTTEVRAPDGSTAAISYTGGRLVRRTMSISGTAVHTEETYDGHGQLVGVNENAGQPGAVHALYGYDVRGQLTMVTIGQQQRTFTYDYRGFLTGEQLPELGVTGNGTRSYPKYDARGHARRIITGSLNGPFDLTYSFDSAERLTRVALTSDDAALKTFAYGDQAAYPQCSGDLCDGKLVEATRYNYDDVLGTTTVKEEYQYAGAGGRASRRDVTVSNATLGTRAYRVSQIYSDLALVSNLTYPCRLSGAACATDRTPPTVNHTYTHGVLTAIGAPTGTLASLTYQPSGAIASVIHGSGASAVTEEWIADPHGMARPSQITVTKSGAATPYWSSGAYAYDGAGNIKSIGDTTYTYDAFGRLTLTQTDRGQGDTRSRVWQRRRYDLFGNATHTSWGFWSATSGSSSADDDSPGGGGAPYDRPILGTTNHYTDAAYDVAGNVTADGDRAFRYDALSMATVTAVGGREYRYLYTAEDERVAVVERVTRPDLSEYNLVTWSIRGFANELLSLWRDDHATGSPQLTWLHDEVWRGSQLLAEFRGSGVRHFSLDHLGSPRVITEASGSLVGVQSFDAFGNGGAADGGPLQFTGHERDAAVVGSGDVRLPDYLHARYYAADLGRFLSPDPGARGADPARPQTWNAYAYVTNNPVAKIDPDGQAERKFIQTIREVARALNRLPAYGPPIPGMVADVLTDYADLAQATDDIQNHVLGNKTLSNHELLSSQLSGSIAGLKLASLAVPAGQARGVTGGAAPVRLGQQGERLAGIVAKKIAIEIPGSLRVRIPDELTLTTLREIKNVAYQARTLQIRDLLTYARDHGVEFILVVRENTKLSRSLQKLVDDGLITLVKELPRR